MKKRKGLFPGWLVPLAFVVLCGYLFFLLIQYAREQGYVRPNERVFVDISGK